MQNEKSLLEKFTKHLNETNNVENMSQNAYLLKHINFGLDLKEEFLEPIINLLMLEGNHDEPKITYTLFALKQVLLDEMCCSEDEERLCGLTLFTALVNDIKPIIEPCIEKSLWDQYEYIFNPKRPNELKVDITDPFLCSLLDMAVKKMNKAA